MIVIDDEDEKQEPWLLKGKRIIPEVGLLENMIPYLLYPKQIPFGREKRKSLCWEEKEEELAGCDRLYLSLNLALFPLLQTAPAHCPAELKSHSHWCETTSFETC